MSDKKLLGVCGWLADKFNMDVSIVRIIFIVFTLLGGAGILVYLILYLAKPNS